MSYGGYNRGPLLNGLSWAFTSISLITVGLRLLSRFIFTRTGGIDDGFIVFAVVCLLGLVPVISSTYSHRKLIIFIRCIILSASIHYGFGSHFETIMPENIHKVLHLMTVLQAIGIQTFCLPKLGVAGLLVRIFNTKALTTTILYGSASLLVAAGFVGSVIVPFCSPTSEISDPGVADKSCTSTSTLQDYGFFLGSFSALLDFAFATYPIVRIFSLQMSVRKKIVISFSLGLGYIAGAVTIYKNAETISLTKNVKDPTYYGVPLEVWNSVESCTLIISACLPTIGPSLQKTAVGLADVRTWSRRALLSSGSRSAMPWSQGTSGARSRRGYDRSGSGERSGEEDGITLSPSKGSENTSRQRDPSAEDEV